MFLVRNVKGAVLTTSRIQAAVLVFVGLAALLFVHRPLVGCVLIAVGVLTGGAAEMWPSFSCTLARFAKVVSGIVSLAAGWLLLAPFYFVFFTAARVWLLLKRQDPLHRTFHDGQSSYWMPVTKGDNHYHHLY